MVKITLTYKAPEGDSKVTEAYGHVFYDGKPEDIDVSDEVAEKFKHNKNFFPAGPPEKAHNKEHK